MNLFAGWRLNVRGAAVFNERGVSRKNFSHAGDMNDSFDRQPSTYPPARVVLQKIPDHTRC